MDYSLIKAKMGIAMAKDFVLSGNDIESLPVLGDSKESIVHTATRNRPPKHPSKQNNF